MPRLFYRTIAFIVGFTVRKNSSLVFATRDSKIVQKMGFAISTILFVRKYCESKGWIILVAIIAVTFYLYLFDAFHWKSTIGRITRVIMFTTLLVLLSAYLLFNAGAYPFGPITLFIISNPLYLLVLKSIFFKAIKTRVYISWLSGPLFAVSVSTIIAWSSWVLASPEHEWNMKVKLREANSSGCPLEFYGNEDCFPTGIDNRLNTCFYEHYNQDLEELEIIFTEGCKKDCLDRVYSDCSTPFIIWVGPILFSISLLFLSFFSTFLRGEGEQKDIIVYSEDFNILHIRF